MTIDETKELEALRFSNTRQSIKIEKLKALCKELIAALDRSAPRKAHELAKRFERESAS